MKLKIMLLASIISPALWAESSSNSAILVTTSGTIIVALLSGFFTFYSKKSETKTILLEKKVEEVEKTNNYIKSIVIEMKKELEYLEISRNSDIDFYNQLDYIFEDYRKTMLASQQGFQDFVYLKNREYNSYVRKVDFKISEQTPELRDSVESYLQIIDAVKRSARKMCGDEFVNSFYQTHDSDIHAFILDIIDITELTIKHHEKKRKFRTRALQFKKQWLSMLICHLTRHADDIT